MNSINKIPTTTVIISAIVFAISVFAISHTAFAIGGDGGGDGGGGGSIGDGCCGSTPTPPKPPTPTPEPPSTPSKKPAKCDAFTVSKTSLPYGGGEVTLTWKTTNSNNVSISEIGKVSPDGSKKVTVTTNKTYTLTAKSADGNATCKVTIKVAEAPKPAAKCDAFTANRTTVPHNGGDVTLSWNTTNATSVSINQGVGSVSADGSKTVHVNANKTFTLTAVGAGGNDDCQVTVKVADAPNAASCDAFTVNKTSLPYGGGDVTLSWNTTNADSVSINQGVGSVAADGSKTVHVTTSKTFTLTAQGAGGNDNCQVTVNVAGPSNLSCDLFTTSKSKVEKGESFTLRWETTNADSVSINQGIGSVSEDGSRSESVDDDTTYTLTAKKGNDEVTCTTSVRVEEEDDDDDDLRCELDISDDEIERGDSVKLSWETEGGDEILLKDDHGNVLVDTDDGDNYDVDEDDIRVKPTRDTEYRLTVFNGNDKETCEVEVEVEDKDVSVEKDRDQEALVIGIPLTHVPYTGFEAGPVLTALFYTLLAAWGFAVAYILVVKKGAIFGFALPRKEAFAAAAATAAPVFAPVSTIPEATVTAPEEQGISALDAKAHDARVLLSNDAREFIASKAVTLEEQLAILDSVIANAKATFPTENGWVILNKVRVAELLG